MNRHVLFYGLYCLGVVIFAGKAISDGYSPFAVAGARDDCSDDDCSDGGYSGSGWFGGSGRHHSFGPTHK